MRLLMGVTVRVIYKNWKGDEGVRVITPKDVYYGATEYHPEPQWLVSAMDEVKQEMRDFALKDMKPERAW